ncbi:MAG: hypothetical protein H6613_18920 [Ignavibacteriales bacterium]|nr:hypothetical protein [Ignavibacteriales bacterium]
MLFPSHSTIEERVEDIVVIANNFIKNFSIEMNKNVFGLTKSAEQKLINYNLPGNIRELKNIIERAVIFLRTRYNRFE